MSSAVPDVLKQLQNDLSQVERDFLAVAQSLRKTDADAGRPALDAVCRALIRTAEAARSVWTACPQCRGPESQRELEKVNQFSGVFALPQCDACRPLAELILGIEKIARAGQKR